MFSVLQFPHAALPHRDMGPFSNPSGDGPKTTTAPVSLLQTSLCHPFTFKTLIWGGGSGGKNPTGLYSAQPPLCPSCPQSDTRHKGALHGRIPPKSRYKSVRGVFTGSCQPKYSVPAPEMDKAVSGCGWKAHSSTETPGKVCSVHCHVRVGGTAPLGYEDGGSSAEPPKGSVRREGGGGHSSSSGKRNPKPSAVPNPAGRGNCRTGRDGKAAKAGAPDGMRGREGGKGGLQGQRHQWGTSMGHPPKK